MSYLSLNEIKTYLGLATTADDQLLTSLLTAARAAIDLYCDRTFAADNDTTRQIDSTRFAVGRTLALDHDLCQLTSITNGDTTATVIGASDYLAQPSDPPFFALVLRDTASVSWEGVVQISGRWAYSITAPDAIVQATREYAAYLYRTADYYGTVAQRGPQPGLPEHLRHTLEGFRRLR
jgi:hypothetical protein